MMGAGKTELAEYLAPHRTARLRSTDKREALCELIALVCADDSARLDPQRVLAAVCQREETLSTKVVPGIAIPHARIEAMHETLVAVGLSAEGIAWDNEGPEPVQLVILILGAGNKHLQVLGQIASRLSNDTLYHELLAASSPSTIHELLTLPYPSVPRTPAPVTHNFSIICFEHALAMARRMGASTIVLHADAVGEISFLDRFELTDRNLIVITRDVSRYPPSKNVARFLSVPFRGLNRSHQVDVAFLFLVSQGMLPREERVVSVCGMPESGVLDTITVTDLKREYRLFFPEGHDDSLHTDVEPQVLSRVLQVASTLAGEGREGKPVGTMFVVGDYEQVKQYCRQMVINPFKGYVEEDLNILDPGLEETIKEFSRIDGAFVLRGNGVIMSAGTFLRTDAEVEQLPSGLGARHAAAALISQQTQALSVALSESTRKLSLFRNGQRILEL